MKLSDVEKVVLRALKKVDGCCLDTHEERVRVARVVGNALQELIDDEKENAAYVQSMREFSARSRR